MPKASIDATPGQPAERRIKGRYPKEFRRDVAALVIEQKRTVTDVAKELGLIAQTVSNWVKAERVARGEADSVTELERQELAQLRLDNKRLTMERDLLKKSTAFWVKEVDR